MSPTLKQYLREEYPCGFPKRREDRLPSSSKMKNILSPVPHLDTKKLQNNTEIAETALLGSVSWRNIKKLLETADEEIEEKVRETRETRRIETEKQRKLSLLHQRFMDLGKFPTSPKSSVAFSHFQGPVPYRSLPASPVLHSHKPLTSLLVSN